MRLLSLSISALILLTACGSRTPSTSSRSGSDSDSGSVSARFSDSKASPSPSASPSASSDSGAVNASSSDSISFSSLSNGSSRVKTAGNRTVATQDELDTLWEEHAGADKQPPTVDFDKQTVLAIFAGPKKSGGYSIKITTIKLAGKELQVRYHLTEPDKGKLTTQVLTYPSHIVKIDRQKAGGDFDSVKFIEE